MISTLMMRVPLPKSDEIFCVTSFHSPPQQKQQLLTQEKTLIKRYLKCRIYIISHYALTPISCG